MKAYALSIQNQVWKSLETIFARYSGGKDYISPTEIEKILKEVLHERTEAEVDYVLKNMFRLDADNNGKIDCEQLGNFFLKSHCGEIALQHMHLQEKMSAGAQRKMNLSEFKILLRNAYEFLGVSIDDEGATAIFNNSDEDKDGWITYKEYFSFVQTYIMKLKPLNKIERKPSPRKIHSRLRKYIWEAVRRLFEKYIKDGQVNGKELEKIIREIMKGESDNDIAFLIYQIGNAQAILRELIKFQQLASFFIIQLGDLGLSTFSKQNPTKRSLTRQQFLLVFRQSYKLLQTYRITNHLLEHFFQILDTNNDGLISFSQYNDWIRNFLAVIDCSYEEYYFESDDEDNPKGKNMILRESEERKVKKYQVVYFTSLELARRARKRCLELIEQFDVNKNRNMEQLEIIEILKILMKSDQFDVFYVVANVFRYDQNQDGFVDYDELTDFFLEMHNGELALQRMHRVNTFKRGDERLLDEGEFNMVMEYGLSFIDVKATNEQLHSLFCDIDQKKSGWISYKQFFQFLKDYFGTRSQIRVQLSKPPTTATTILRKDSLQKLTPQQKLARLIIDQLTTILRNYTAFQTLDKTQLIRFLKQVFQLQNIEIDYVLRNIFRYLVNKSGLPLEMELVRIFLYLFFAEIVLLRMHRKGEIKRGKERMISLEEFLEVFRQGTKWMKKQIPRELLVLIFEIIDTNKDGFITYLEFVNFIKKHFSNQKTEWDFPEFEKKESIKNSKSQPLYQEIWSQLRALYHHYVKGQYLQYSQLQPLVKQVLHQTTSSELQYIFWNMFRVDPNGDHNIQFEQFAPFILSHSGEIALQRFHYQQAVGKSKLNRQEFKLVFREAYRFLKTIDKRDEILDWVFDDLDEKKEGMVTYKKYLGWIEGVISKTVR